MFSAYRIHSANRKLILKQEKSSQKLVAFDIVRNV